MTSLVSVSSGRALEPSAGAGHLVSALETTFPDLDITAVELDSNLGKICRGEVTYTDFFKFADSSPAPFDVIFGNPPYVAFKSMEASTKISAAATKAHFSDKVNLYQLFIYRLADLLAPGGQMVLIVPKEWLFADAASPLRARLASLGAVTHLVDCGEEKLFADADVPALLIFRFVKAAAQGPVLFAPSASAAASGAFSPRSLSRSGSRWSLLPALVASATSSWGTLSDQLVPKVGLVTGADDVFRLADPSIVEPECVQQQVCTSKSFAPFLNVNDFEEFADIPPLARAYLLRHEARLRARRIANFTDSSWWRYGAIRNLGAMKSSQERFFALAKTRSGAPFFEAPGGKFFTGAVIGLFRKPSSNVSCALAVSVLNSSSYREVFEGFFLTSGGRLSLQPSVLCDLPFPSSQSAAEDFLSV